MAEFLNTYFASFDSWLLGIGASLHSAAGEFFDPVFFFITLFGEKGLFMIVLSQILVFIPKTRKIGVTMLISLAIGALLTNVVLKPIVARVRPYEAVELFRGYWEAVGHGPEHDFSFPSGHTNAAFSTFTGLFLACKNKKIAWMIFIPAVLIAFSRIYIAVHYPTDVIGGMIVGVLSALAAHFVVSRYWDRFEKKEVRLKKDKANGE